ncbi:MAG: hypothetical protein AAGM21_13160 [Pseudomonadota bacterium]
MTTPNDKPNDLPDLPLRPRFARLGILVFTVAFALIALANNAGLLPNSSDSRAFLNRFLVVVAVLIAVFTWLGQFYYTHRDTHADRTRREAWWQVTMKVQDDGLAFRWEPQSWRDLSPSRGPVLWKPWLYTLPFVYLPILIVGLGALHPVIWWVQPYYIWLGIAAFGAGVFVFGMQAPFFAGVAPRACSSAHLSQSSVGYVGADICMAWGGPIGLAGCEFLRILTRGIRFAPDGVRVLAPSIFIIFSRDFTIPTRDPDQRRAIAQWAAAHNIPVTGDI